MDGELRVQVGGGWKGVRILYDDELRSQQYCYFGF
jgi:hypothetical protein